jgi:hypothetical protein
MLASHPCASCGLELRRIPAPPDPVYGLPVVVCPRCGAAVVRRKHRTMPRATRLRCCRVAGALLTRAVAALIVTAAMLPLVGLVSEAATQPTLGHALARIAGPLADPRSSESDRTWFVVMWASLLGLGALGGTLSSLLLPHLRAGGAALVLLAWIAGLFVAWQLMWPDRDVRPLYILLGIAAAWTPPACGALAARVLSEPRQRSSIRRPLRRERRRRARSLRT